MKMPFLFGVAALALLAAGCANNSASNQAAPAAAPVAVTSKLPPAVSAPGWDPAKPVVAPLSGPRSIAVDGAGNLYVASVSDSSIQKINSGGDDVVLAAPAEGYVTPCGVAVDGLGNVYVANTDDEAICKITPDGKCGVLAGLSGNAGSDDGAGTAARFNTPTSVAVDGAGNVYVADNASSTVRKITPMGVVTTLAGKAGSQGQSDGTGADARFNAPRGIAVDAMGNVYVADEGNDNIRKVTPDGVVTTLAGVAGKAGYADGAGSAATFGSPHGVAVDAVGNVYVADTDNNLVRKITQDSLIVIAGNISTDHASAVVTTLAGNVTQAGDNDGTGAAAQFSGLRGIAVDAAGNVFVADSDNNSIRRVTPAGVVI